MFITVAKVIFIKDKDTDIAKYCGETIRHYEGM